MIFNTKIFCELGFYIYRKPIVWLTIISIFSLSILLNELTIFTSSSDSSDVILTSFSFQKNLENFSQRLVKQKTCEKYKFNESALNFINADINFIKNYQAVNVCNLFNSLASFSHNNHSLRSPLFLA